MRNSRLRRNVMVLAMIARNVINKSKNLTDIKFKQQQTEYKCWERDRFTVRVCDDVLIGILNFGNRRCLAWLEEKGSRFYRCVEHHLPKAPFVIFNMECKIYEKSSTRPNKVLSYSK